MPTREARARVAKLFADHRDRLQQYLRARLANPDDAAELAQEAYLRLLRVKRVDMIRHPQAYLFRIAHNLLHELYTGRQMRIDADTDAETELDALESAELTPDESAVLAGRRAMIEKAMSELPVKCRAALVLYWREGFTQKEIAERMNLSRQMVQKYLAQGLAHCQKRLRHIAAEERRDRAPGNPQS